jgi:hypothetical protein
MATFNWPATLTPQSVAWGIQKSGVSFRSPMGGSLESIEFPGQFWKASVTLAAAKLRNGGEGEAFFSRLAGGSERVLVPYWPRLVPRGTTRGTPNLHAAAARGDLVLVLNTTGSTDTLKAGDMIGAGGQLFQVFQDCAAVAGVLTVPLVNRVRAVIASAAAVTWNAPTFVGLMPATSNLRGYEPGVATTLPIELEEVPS